MCLTRVTSPRPVRSLYLLVRMGPEADPLYPSEIGGIIDSVQSIRLVNRRSIDGSLDLLDE